MMDWNSPPHLQLEDVLIEPPRAGATCPRCEQGHLDYNGLLELECDQCGYTLSGGAGCT